MRNLSAKIIATRDPAEIIGRDAEIDRLVSQARGVAGLAILAEPAAGTSELLRQTYDRLFTEQREIIPFYFEIKQSDASAFDCACRMARAFLTQAMAFLRRDGRIISAMPDLDEIARLAMPDDIAWVDQLIETIRTAGVGSGCPAGIRSLLSSPFRTDRPVFVMLDGLENLASLELDIEDLIQALSASGKPFVIAGHRRFMFAKTDLPVLHLDRLAGSELAKAVSSIASSHRVALNDASRDLIATQLGGDLHLIRHLIGAAAASGISLDSFENVERIYTDEIFGGRIARYFDTALAGCVRDGELQTEVASLLAEARAAGNTPVPIAYWRRKTELRTDLSSTLQQLSSRELIDLFPGSTRLNAENTAFGDYLDARFSLEQGKARALCVGEALAANLQRAPKTMAGVYRRQAAIGLGEVLARFNGQAVSSAAIDYGRFSAELKGGSEEYVRTAFNDDTKRIALPDIAYSASTVSFYPKLAGLIEAERTAVAIGFNADDKSRVTWIAAEIDSKLEANKELTEFWCDRLEMVAHACDLDPFTIWLVAPEGFSPEATEVLRARNAFGSSRRQVGFLDRLLEPAATPTAVSSASEYQFSIPMGADTELIAARAIEDVAKRHKIPQKTTNQIKTALVEACINASEHSLSPDAKITLKAVVDDEKIVISVANRGVRLADKAPTAANEEARRGWGLKLIRGLMDDLQMQDTDDGTVVTMTKLIPRT